MKQLMRFLGCVVLFAVMAHCHGCNNASPPASNASSQFPEFVVGVWEAQASTNTSIKWGFKFEPDGSISKLIHVFAGPINVKEGGAYLEGPDPNTYAKFDLGPCEAKYDAATMELSVVVVLDHYRMVLPAGVVEGNSVDFLEGPVSEKEETWRAEWRSYNTLEGAKPPDPNIIEPNPELLVFNKLDLEALAGAQ